MSTPSEGGQSRKHPVVGSSSSSSAVRTTYSRPVRVSRSASARGQLDGGRQQVDAVVGRDQHLGGVDALGEHVMHGELEVLRVDAERERQAGLRIEVDEQHPAALLGERGAQRRDGGRLGDAALLVGDRE